MNVVRFINRMWDKHMERVFISAFKRETLAKFEEAIDAIYDDSIKSGDGLVGACKKIVLFTDTTVWHAKEMVKPDGESKH